MDYIKFVAGFFILAVFAWLAARNRDRRGVLFSLFQFDILLGLAAGVYLIITSAMSLLS
jgi:hypothetical protein